jgi:hypothetical protein
MMNQSNTKIPRWIYIYAGFLILTAIIGGYAGYVDPYVFFGAFKEYNINMNELPHNFLNGLWGSRNIGALIVLTIGILSKRPQVMMAIFMHRFFVEFQDIFILGTFVNPPADMQTVVISYGVGTALFLFPEAYGAWTLWKLTKE